MNNILRTIAVWLLEKAGYMVIDTDIAEEGFFGLNGLRDIGTKIAIID